MSTNLATSFQPDVNRTATKGIGNKSPFSKRIAEISKKGQKIDFAYIAAYPENVLAYIAPRIMRDLSYSQHT